MSNQKNGELNISSVAANNLSNFYVSNAEANLNELANDVGSLRISAKPPKTADNRNRVWITNKNYWAHPNSANSKRMKDLYATPKPMNSPENNSFNNNNNNNKNNNYNNKNNNNNNSNNGLGHNNARPFKKIKMNRKTRKANRKGRKANRKSRKN
jgi:hypothetical protein